MVFLTTLVAGTIAGHAQQIEVYRNGVLDRSIPCQNQQECLKLAEKEVSALQHDGFITCFFTKSDSTYTIETGSQYSWNDVQWTPSSLKPDKKSLFTGHVNGQKLETWIEEKLTYFDNHGYPFATIQTLDPRIDSNSIGLTISLEQGPLVVFDSLHVKSESSWNTNFFQIYSGIRTGELYDESKISSLGRRINNLPYVTVSRNPEVSFTESGANIYLYLKEVPASRFNGIVGIQQNESGKSVITGEVNFSLQNKLRRGERFFLDWRRLQTSSQDLHTGFSYPYLFKTEIGFSGELEILRLDSSFSRSRQELGVIYQFSGPNRLTALFENRSTFSLGGSGGSFEDVKIKGYGLAVDISKLDQLINPSRGLALDSEITAGRRTYESEDLTVNSVQWKLELDGQFLFPIYKAFVLSCRGQFGSLIGEKTFENEQYRVGGFHSLRGFDEASIVASTFAVGTAEVRYRFDQYSNVFAFVDQAWYESNSPDSFIADTPLGIGLGTSLRTGGGIFNLSYGLGRANNSPFQFRNAKIHFGYTAVF